MHLVCPQHTEVPIWIWDLWHVASSSAPSRAHVGMYHLSDDGPLSRECTPVVKALQRAQVVGFTSLNIVHEMVQLQGNYFATCIKEHLATGMTVHSEAPEACLSMLTPSTDVYEYKRTGTRVTVDTCSPQCDFTCEVFPFARHLTTGVGDGPVRVREIVHIMRMPCPKWVHSASHLSASSCVG